MIASISIRLACCAVALLAAACGASPQAANQPPSDAQMQRWAQCMNQHGVHVTVSSSGKGQGTAVHSQADAGQPGDGQQQMLAAQEACKQFQPNSGGNNDQPPSAQRLDQAAKYVQCVNQHGGDAQVAKDGGIEEQPGPGGPAVEAQADEACKSLAPDGR
jgi:hypothetical protein